MTIIQYLASPLGLITVSSLGRYGVVETPVTNATTTVTSSIFPPLGNIRDRIEAMPPASLLFALSADDSTDQGVRDEGSRAAAWAAAAMDWARDWAAAGFGLEAPWRGTLTD